MDVQPLVRTWAQGSLGVFGGCGFTPGAGRSEPSNLVIPDVHNQVRSDRGANQQIYSSFMLQPPTSYLLGTVICWRGGGMSLSSHCWGLCRSKGTLRPPLKSSFALHCCWGWVHVPLQRPPPPGLWALGFGLSFLHRRGPYGPTGCPSGEAGRRRTSHPPQPRRQAGHTPPSAVVHVLLSVLGRRSAALGGGVKTSYLPPPPPVSIPPPGGEPSLGP